MAETRTSGSPIGVQKFLKGVDYPADKEKLLAAAQKNGAPEQITAILRQLPANQFDGPDDVMRAYGEME